MQSSCKITIDVIISVAFLLIGIPIWLVGNEKPLYYHSNVLTSIPLYRTTEDGLAEYIGVNPTESQVVYNISNLNSIKLELAYTDISNPRNEQDIYLIHNLWGYHINFSIVGGITNHTYFTKVIDRNIDDLPISNPNIVSVNDFVPSCFRFRNYYQVKCPLPTQITKENRIEPGCADLGGYPMSISQCQEVLKIGSFVFHDPIPPMYAVFDHLRVFPMNYIDIPQMFLLSWRKTNHNELISAGSFFTVFGLIVLIYAPILEFC